MDSDPSRDLNTRQQDAPDPDALGLVSHRSILTGEGAQAVEEALTVEESSRIVIGLRDQDHGPPPTCAEVTASSEELGNCRVI